MTNQDILHINGSLYFEACGNTFNFVQTKESLYLYLNGESEAQHVIMLETYKGESTPAEYMIGCLFGGRAYTEILKYLNADFHKTE